MDTIRAFSGGFVSWNPLQPGINDFVIENGYGFFVQLAAQPISGVFQITGPPIVAPLSIHLGVGFNLVNFPVTGRQLTPSILAEEIKAAVHPPAQVSDVVDTIRAFRRRVHLMEPPSIWSERLRYRLECGLFRTAFSGCARIHALGGRYTKSPSVESDAELLILVLSRHSYHSLPPDQRLLAVPAFIAVRC